MKHISELLQSRKQQFTRIEERSQQIRLFSLRTEKGSSEWKAFDPVRNDKVSAYPVRMSRKPIAVVQPHHVLRLVYPPAQLTSGR